jgi:exosortase
MATRKGTLPGQLDQPPVSKMSPLLLFSILGAFSLAIWWNALKATLALALNDDQFTHILLIIPISATLIVLEWKPAESSDHRHKSIGAALLSLALLIAGTVKWRTDSLPSDIQLSLNMIAFVVWWVAGYIFCFGIRAFRRGLFPLLFLLWLVPLPEFVLNRIVVLLQQGSAVAAHLIFIAARVPVGQRGLLLDIPGLTLEVAPECSSIRSSLMLVVTSMVLAQLFLRSNWRKALVVAAAIPLSVAKNGLRIFAIGFLGTRVNRAFLTGRLHRQGGIIFFLFALAVMFLLLWIFRRQEKRMLRNHPHQTS